MNIFNLFETCFLDVNKKIFLEKRFISSESKEIITLLKYKDKKLQKTFHLGDIFYEKKTNNYYVFSFLKDKRLLNQNGICGFGFYNFDTSNTGDFNLCYMKEFTDKFNEKAINNDLVLIGNAFFNKNDIKDDYYHHFLNVKNLNNFYIYLKKDEIMRYYELQILGKIEFFVVRNIIDIKDFYFYIKTYQMNCFNKETLDAYEFINGSLFILNDYAKGVHKTNKDLFSKELYMTPSEAYALPDDLYDNILVYYDKIFVYLDSNGFVNFTSINENNEEAKKSKKVIYIKNYLFDNILPVPFSIGKEREIYLDNLLTLIS